MSANMFSQRAFQLTARRLAATSPSSLTKISPLARLSAPVAIATGRIQYRPAATETISQSAGTSILAAQRRNRPVSPHLTIYKPQVTWIPSALNRITGVQLSGTMYLFGVAYLVAPTLGWHLDTHSIAAGFASLPFILQFGLKAIYALPFTFHSFNGLRHLMWDTGSGITNKQVIVTGWTVIGISVASALGLALI